MKPYKLCDTKGMSEADWLKMREHGPKWADPSDPEYLPVCIGGSTVGAIMGVSPWVTPLEVYETKRGLALDTSKINAEAKLRGHVWEPYVAEMVPHMPGYEGATIIDDTGFYQHPLYPFATANLDRRIIHNGVEGVLEIKTTSYRNYDTIEAWKNDIVPIYYEYQIRWYMAIMDLPYADIICAWGMGTSDMHIIHVERDLHIEKMLLRKVSEFVSNIEKGIPPKMDEIDPDLADESLRRLYTGRKGLPDMEFNSDVYFRTFKGLREVINQEKEVRQKYEAELARLEIRKKMFSSKILSVLKDAETGFVEKDGEKITVSFKRISRSSIDAEAIKKADPDLYKTAQKTTTFRKLTVK